MGKWSEMSSPKKQVECIINYASLLLSKSFSYFLCQSRLDIYGENMPIPTIQQAFALYETCVKTCNLCDDNSRCNSCKENTKAQWSTLEKFHFKAPISTFSLATPSTSHSGEKSNKCNQCDFVSSYASALRTHLKTHSGEKSNKCNQCDFASSQAGYLRRHSKTHSGEKLNKCNQCDFACSDPSSLRRHMKRHRSV